LRRLPIAATAGTAGKHPSGDEGNTTKNGDAGSVS
jgi:hypothetical protein